MNKIILFILLSTSLFGTSYTLQQGWNLLGSNQSIEVSRLLSNPSVRNVVIYANGVYKSSASNEFSTIPKNSGFFVYTDNTTSITIEDTLIPSSQLQHLDGTLNLVTGTVWDILKVVDANLLVEMKTSTFNAGLTYTHAEATSYCQRLTIGTVSGWRLPTFGEMQALSDVYLNGNENDFLIRLSDSFYWTSSDGVDTSKAYNWLFGTPTSSFYQTIDKTDIRYGICVKSL